MSNTWKLVKYNGDGAIYARCECGFQYCCSSTSIVEGKRKFLCVPYKFYQYCPFCGTKKEEYTLIHKIDKTVADFPFNDKEFYEKVYSMDDFFMNADYKDWFEPDTTY